MTLINWTLINWVLISVINWILIKWTLINVMGKSRKRRLDEVIEEKMTVTDHVKHSSLCKTLQCCRYNFPFSTSLSCLFFLFSTFLSCLFFPSSVNCHCNHSQAIKNGFNNQFTTVNHSFRYLRTRGFQAWKLGLWKLGRTCQMFLEETSPLHHLLLLLFISASCQALFLLHLCTLAFIWLLSLMVKFLKQYFVY